MWSTQSKNSITAHRDSRNCLTSSCQAPPLADFVANTTVLSTGGAVDFTDLSFGNPTSWSWNFGNGGTPNTSSVKNPSGIVFNTPGTYTVTMIATNANGSDTATKVNYIKVNANKGCDTLNFGFYTGADLPKWTLQNYYVSGGAVGENGWVNGVNQYKDKAKAQYFPSVAPNTHIMGAWLHISLAQTDEPNKTIAVKVWDEMNGNPNNEIASVDVSMQQVMDNVDGNYFTQVLFNPPIPVPDSGRFFMGVDFSNLNWASDKDTFNIISNKDKETTPSMVWQLDSSGTWVRYNTGSAWALDLSLGIFPFMSENPPTLVTTHTDECESNCNGTATVDVNGGTSPYTYKWYDANGNVVGTNKTLIDMCSGDYVVFVTQQTGCTGGYEWETISSASNTVSVTTSKTNILCGGECNGQVSAIGDNGTPPYTYEWLSVGTGQSMDSLCPGSYTVKVTDANGCSQTKLETVTEPAPLVVVATAQSKDVAGACNGTATGSAVDGTPPYVYLWDDANSQTSATATGLCTGTYNFCVTDANGCMVCDTAYVDLGVGLSQLDGTGIALYPNPARDMFTVQLSLSAQTAVTVRVMNAIGQEVYAEQLETQSSKLDVDMSSRPDGVYLVVVDAGDVRHIQRLVISRQ
ncbi:MAG: T9SS type A sorting domain-containing protein [Flavobacteriales bacterium]|nr:T9SS type A sorting domain-containing protein [Flavobacteriales bacterium]MCB9448323.1 T9SS type A sorting domain-containing protein [Flavobacteriales bacterium]